MTSINDNENINTVIKNKKQYKIYTASRVDTHQMSQI